MRASDFIPQPSLRRLDRIQVRRYRGPRRCTALLLAVAILALNGCVPILIGGAAMGAAALHDRRSYTALIDDQRIELTAANALASEPGLKDSGRISVTSYNYLVLLTGQVRNAADVALAGQVVSRLPKVRKVINEVTVGPPIGLSRQSEDTLLTSKVKLELFKVKIPGFDPTRVKVVTEDAVVYLMGLVTQAEGDGAAAVVRYVPGVVRVVKIFEYQESKT